MPLQSTLLFQLVAWAFSLNAMSGEVWVWGSASNTKTNIPTGATNLVSLSSGPEHLLTARSDGALIAWGWNTSGQTNVPNAATNALGIAAGYDNNLVLLPGGQVFAWGNNANNKSTPPAAATNLPVASVTAGGSHSAVVRQNGTVFAWGSSSFGVTNVPASATNVVRLAASSTSAAFSHDVALRSDGTVVAWGDNSWGRTNVPLTVSNIVAVAAGGEHSLALRANGTVVGWGNSRATPPSGATNVVAIAAGGSHSLALRRDGTIVAWGLITSGQTTVPTAITNLASFAIAAGFSHSAALVGDGFPRFVDSLGALVAYSNRLYTLNALAVGAEPLSYQWLKDGTNLPGEVGGILTITNVQPTAAGEYRVVVSNPQGVITGLVAQLTVAVAPDVPQIIQQPASTNAIAGTAVGFQTAATANPTATFQWQFNNASIAGANTPEFSIPYVVPANAGNYRVIVANSVGAVTSLVATLTVDLPSSPVFTNWTGSRAAPVGSPVTLSTTAISSEAISYRWELNGTLLPFGMGQTLNLTAVGEADAGIYRAIASNSLGVAVSPAIQLTPINVAAWGNTQITNLPGTLSNTIAIVGGSAHGLALKADGTVATWGNSNLVTGFFPNYITNNYGQTTVPSGLSNVVAVAAGLYHNLVLRADGSAFAWGLNSGSQTNVPTDATNLISVAAGDAHNLGLRADGTVLGWGTNQFGQLNIPATATNIVALAAGTSHSVGLDVDGRIHMWGSGASGQTNVPAGVTNIVAIAARANYTLALREDGTVITWGNGGPEFVGPLVPINYGGTAPNSDYTAISAGPALFTLLRSGGGIETYGGSSALRLSFQAAQGPAWLRNVVGLASADTGFALIRPPNGLPTLQVAERQVYVGQPAVFSAAHAGQRLASYRWRRGTTNLSAATGPYLLIPSTQLADAGDYSVVITDTAGAVTSSVAHLTVSLPPAPPITQQPVAQTVGAGMNASFSVATVTTVPANFQWQFNGTNISGATGNFLTISNAQDVNTGDYRVIASNLSGSVTSMIATLTVTSTTPTFVTQPQSRAFAPGATALFSCSAKGSEPISFQWLWNDNLLSGENLSSLSITNVSGALAGAYRAIATNSVGSVTSTPAILSMVSVAAWGSNAPVRNDIPPPLQNSIALAAGTKHALAINPDGTVTAWGDNTCGQTNVPLSATSVIGIAAGESHSLALRDDGSVLAWGSSGLGQSAVPVGLANVRQVAAGLVHNVALRADGTVTAWGSNFRKETSVPEGLSNVTAIAAGGFHNLALKSDGTTVVWGDITNLPPAAASNVVAVSAGFAHCAALRNDGTVVAWGTLNPSEGFSASFGCSSGSGISGLIKSFAVIPSPPQATNVVAIASGRFHIVALRGDGTILAWGDNSAGQCDVETYSDLIAVAAGGYQSFALQGTLSPRLGTVRSQRNAVESDAVVLGFVSAGAAPLQGQWQRTGLNIPAETHSTLFLSSVTVGDSGNFQFISSNAHGAVTGAVQLAVAPSAPILVNSPTGAVIGAGSPFTMNAAFRGSAPLFYQWRKNGVNVQDGASISGSGTPILNLLSPTVGDSGSYTLRASNSVGVLTSAAASLTVLPHEPLAEALDNTSVTWTTGGDTGWRWQTLTSHDSMDSAQTGTFTNSQTNWVEAIVSGPTIVGFWWKGTPAWFTDGLSFLVDSVEVLKVTDEFDWRSQSYFVPEGVHQLRWSFNCRNPFEDDSTAWLDQVQFAAPAVGPTISTQPTSRTVSSGASTTFSVTASGTLPLGYQWLLDDSPIPGATNASYTRAGAQVADAGNYSTIITNIGGMATSQVAVLTVLGAAPGMGRLWNQTAAPGMDVSFNPTLTGSSQFTAQWFRNGTPLADATAAELTITNVASGNEGAYQLVLQNEFGTAVGDEVRLDLVPVAMWGSISSANTFPFTFPPTSQPTIVPADVGDVAAVAAGGQIGYALRADGSVAFWGSDNGNIPAAINPSEQVVSVAAGTSHGLGLRANGTVTGWGSDTYGQSTTPQGVSNFISIAAGSYHSLALTDDGHVSSWGNPANGLQLIPENATNFIMLAGGGDFSVGVQDDGRLIAWGGTNGYGQLNPPVIDNGAVVAAGANHGLVLCEDGRVLGWGRNDYGQATPPAGLSNTVAIAAGDEHSLALTADGRVTTWGRSPFSQTNAPTNLSKVIAITGGRLFSLALVGDGRPFITTQPRRKRAEIGGSTTLGVFAVGSAPLSYQWQFNGTNVSGATNASLVIGNLGLNHLGSYSVIVSNELGIVESTPIELVPAPPVLRFDSSPGAVLLDSAGLHLRVLGLSGAGPLVILASTNLQDWLPIHTNAPLVGSVDYIDIFAVYQPHRYYRAIEVSSTPANSLRLINPVILESPSGRMFRATVTGLLGSGPAIIHESTDLSAWLPVATNVPTFGEWVFERQLTNNPAIRWYRAAELR